IERVAGQYQAGHYIRPIGAIRKAVKIGETEAVRIDGEHVTEILRPAAIGCAIKGAAGQNQARFRAIAVAGGFAETVKIGETGAVRMDGKYFAIAMRTTLLGRAVQGVAGQNQGGAGSIAVIVVKTDEVGEARAVGIDGQDGSIAKRAAAAGA